MRNILTIILLTLTCGLTLGNTLDSANTNKFRIGLSFSTDYCYRSLTTDPSLQWLVDSRNDREIPKLGFTTGLRINRGLADKFSLELGILYSDKGEKTEDIIFTNIFGEVTGTAIIVYHYAYLDLPLRVNYIFMHKKMVMMVTGGMSTNVFLNYKTVSTTEYADGSTDINSSSSDEYFEPVNLAALAGLGVEFGISEKLDLRIETIFRRSVTSIVDASIKQFPYSFGLNVGIYY